MSQAVFVTFSLPLLQLLLTQCTVHRVRLRSPFYFQSRTHVTYMNINYVAEIQVTCCGQQATCCPQHVPCPRNLLPRNMLRWCKRGLRRKNELQGRVPANSHKLKRSKHTDKLLSLLISKLFKTVYKSGTLPSRLSLQADTTHAV